MKKVLLVCAMGAFLFACGDDEKDKEEDKISACDCKKESEELMKDMMGSAMSGDESKMKDFEAKAKALEEDCKDYKAADYKECK